MNYNLYWFYLLSSMLIMRLVKDHDLFSGFYQTILEKTKSKRLILISFCILGGIIPIPGRIIASATLLNSITTTSKKDRSRLGILNYLLTHHFYFWSPLEVTVILSMSFLKLDYLGFIHLIYPILIFYFVIIMVFISIIDMSKFEIVMKKDSEDLKPSWYPLPLVVSIILLIVGVQPYFTFTATSLLYLKLCKVRFIDSWKLIDWKLILYLIIIVSATMYFKHLIAIELLLRSIDTTILLLMLAWIITFILGSSAKYAAITIVLSSLLGSRYFVLLFVFEYTAYFLSPFHHCIMMTKRFFNITWGYLYLYLVSFCLILSIFTFLVYGL